MGVAFGHIRFIFGCFSWFCSPFRECLWVINVEAHHAAHCRMEMEYSVVFSFCHGTPGLGSIFSQCRHVE